MFDFVRSNTKIMMGLLFLLIIPSFVLFGIEGYSRIQDKGAAVAKIDGRVIYQSEWDAAHKAEADRARASMPNLDAKLLDAPEARYATLERLVRERVLSAASDNLRLTTSDARLARDLAQNPSIAALRRPDGTMDIEAYRQLVGSQGLSPEMFEAQVRADLSSRQVLQGVSGSAFSTPAQAKVALEAFFEPREIQVARFLASDYVNQLKLTDEDLVAYHKSHEAQFQSPEQADIEYVVLDIETIRQSMTVNEADLKTYYEQNAARLSGKEERRASHILINAAKGAPQAERDSARAKAQELLTAVKKAPDSFADLAKKNSQDTGSASQGGDLNFFARGAMVKPFEDATFALKKGDISDLVESEFGYHIIRLTDIKAPPVRSFEQMRAEIETDLKKQQAQKKFAELAETFSNGVYEESDSLKPVAERLKLSIQTANGIKRTQPQAAAGAGGPLANAKLLAALFAPDAIEKNRNTEAVETGPSQLTAGRIVKYSPARTRPLDEVKEAVRTRLMAQRGAELAKKEGQAKLAEWRTSPAKTTLAPAVTVSREQTLQLPVPLIDAALRADPSTLPAWVGVDLGGVGYAVVRVNKVQTRPPANAEKASQEAAQYQQLWAMAESQAYLGTLKERHKTQVLVTKPAATQP